MKLCTYLGHKWKFLFSCFLNKPFKECKRCGEQDYLTKEEYEKETSSNLRD